MQLTGNGALLKGAGHGGQEMHGFPPLEALLASTDGLRFSNIFGVVTLWLVNLPPPNVPPQKWEFNKALLRETNG